MQRERIPKFHLFRRNGRNFVFDCHTFAILIVDDLAYDVLQAYDQEQCDSNAAQERLDERYADEIVRNILQEIEMLRENGYLVNNESLPVGIRVEPADADQLRSNGITLMMAQACNLSCAYCYNNVGSFTAYPRLMDTNTARQAVDFLVERSGGCVCKVGFFGGEPLLNFNLIRKVVIYCDSLREKKGLQFKFSLTTNGTLLSDEVLNFLCAHEFGIVLSLDGPREVHDACRRFPDGRGSFDHVMEAVRKIKNAGHPLWIRATLTHQSPPLEQLLQFFEHKIKADRVLIGPMLDDVGDADHLSLTEGDLDDWWAQEKQMPARNLPYLTERRSVPYNPFLEPLRRLHHREGQVFSCDAGKGQIAVATNGDIYPCHRFVGLEAFVIGNVWDGLDGKRWADFFNNFDEASQKCKSCWAYYQCGGGCARLRALDNGTFGPPDDKLCRHWQRSFEFAIATYAIWRKEHPDVMDWVAKRDKNVL